MVDQEKLTHRRILYGRRQGRKLRTGQRTLLKNLLPSIEIDLPTGSEDFSPPGLFAVQTEKVWLEIGFGGGEHLAWQAKKNPSIGFIGCEPFINGVVKLLVNIRDDDLGNIRLYRDDARQLLDRLPAASLDRVFILFPDPWAKARHNKRRIISTPVLDRLAGALRDGAELRIGTDDPSYLEWILWHMQKQPAFAWQARVPQDWRVRPDDWPETRYEQKAARAGRCCAFLTYIRQDRQAR